MKKQSAIRVMVPPVTIGCLAAAFGMGWAFAPKSNLYINGTLASSHVFDHNGMACAPIADIAKALNLSVIAKADGYAITPAGGANQVGGLNGKIGDKLTNGEVVFTVVKVERTDKYAFRFGDTKTYTPDRPTDDLVVVTYRIKNARPASSWLVLAGDANTAVTDQDEHSYSPDTFGKDWHSGEPTVLPGSAVDFAMIYQVPKSEKLGDAVYQIRGSGFKGSTFRVSIASVNQ